jgi:pantothenate kinase type III
MEALTNRAAALPKIELGAPRSLIGKTTIDAIRSGVIYGFAGSVDGIMRRLRAEMGPRPRRSPPAGWPSTSSPSPRRSTRRTTC